MCRKYLSVSLFYEVTPLFSSPLLSPVLLHSKKKKTEISSCSQFQIIFFLGHLCSSFKSYTFCCSKKYLSGMMGFSIPRKCNNILPWLLGVLLQQQSLPWLQLFTFNHKIFKWLQFSVLFYCIVDDLLLYSKFSDSICFLGFTQESSHHLKLSPI